METAMLRERYQTLLAFVEQIAISTLERFAISHPHLYLLQEPAHEASGQGSAFGTVALGEASPPWPDGAAATGDVDVPHEWLVAIRHARDGAPQTPITLGRGSGNDVVLPFARVSKVHAAFLPRVGLPGLALVDLHSTNGTSVNGRPLVPGVAVDIGDGDRVALGGLPFSLMGAESLYRYLPILARRLHRAAG